MGSALVCSSTRDSAVVAHKQEHSESQLEISCSLQSQPQLPANHQGKSCMMIKVRNQHLLSDNANGLEDQLQYHENETPEELKCNKGYNEEETATPLKLKLLLQQLDQGQVPHITELRRVMSLACEVLASKHEKDVAKSDEDRLGIHSVRDTQVREWLSTTFTRTDSVYESHHDIATRTPISKFKAAANTIIITQYLGSITKDLPLPSQVNYPQELTLHLQEHMNLWEFDMFQVDTLSGGRNTLRCIAHDLFKRYNLFEKYEISTSPFDSFIVKMEEGYGHHSNPYHNACHGADVAQTLHYIIHATGFKTLMSDLEILSVLLAALVHDVDHPGTSNSFQINQRSEYALLYNDRSVLENHHLFYTFKCMQEVNNMSIRSFPDTDCNFLECLSSEDYKLVRGLMIEMVLSTDMSSHFDQLKNIRHIMSLPEAGSQLLGAERAEVFSLLLHLSDISHPGKPWTLHHEWSKRLAKEFFRQGDQEKQLGLPPSPLCDPDKTNLPTSQLGFIEYIVSPLFEVCGDMLELLLTPPQLPMARDASHDSQKQSHDSAFPRVWEQYLVENKFKWEEERDRRDLKGTEETKEGSEGNGLPEEGSEVFGGSGGNGLPEEMEGSKVNGIAEEQSETISVGLEMHSLSSEARSPSLVVESLTSVAETHSPSSAAEAHSLSSVILTPLKHRQTPSLVAESPSSVAETHSPSSVAEAHSLSSQQIQL